MATAIELMQNDLKAHARTLTELVVQIADLKKEVHTLIIAKAVNEAEEKKDEEALERRLSRIENGQKSLYTLGLWLLGTFGAAFVAALANFIIKGGLTITTITTP